MDIRLTQIKKDKILIRRSLKISKFIFNIIFILISIFILSYIKDNRLLVLSIILLVHVNINLFIRILFNTLRVGLTWRNIEEFIEGIELGKVSIENIQSKLIGDEDYRYFLGKQYGKVAEEIKNILDRVVKSIDNINRNEKMNIELVNNVTNKLDKPLESILENIEKLKEDKNDEEAIYNLKYRSNNIKLLIDELFEAAKVSSGDINIYTEKIEISSLLKQALIEYKDKIDSSRLVYKISIPKEKIYIRCNGEKMWRVFDILIHNTLKHSLDGSRVYVDLFTKDNRAYITIRNVSKEELNIEPDDLVNIINKNNEEDRSGLALEIAKNLVLLQNGDFDLDIKADLFSVIISFEIYKEESENDDKQVY